jgi:hypothetical protein
VSRASSVNSFMDLKSDSRFLNKQDGVHSKILTRNMIIKWAGDASEEDAGARASVQKLDDQ